MGIVTSVSIPVKRPDVVALAVQPQPGRVAGKYVAVVRAVFISVYFPLQQVGEVGINSDRMVIKGAQFQPVVPPIEYKRCACS